MKKWSQLRILSIIWLAKKCTLCTTLTLCISGQSKMEIWILNLNETLASYVPSFRFLFFTLSESITNEPTLYPQEYHLLNSEITESDRSWPSPFQIDLKLFKSSVTFDILQSDRDIVLLNLFLVSVSLLCSLFLSKHKLKVDLLLKRKCFKHTRVFAGCY